jgi:serine/threonine-protein phosphatase 2A regulatory subunit B
MEELTEVITAAEFHPLNCNQFVYSSSKGTIRLCDMRSAALCDQHAKLFEEPEDNEVNNKSFFREIISSISDVKMSNSGRYMMSRDYLSIKVWDLHMETKPVETYSVRLYLHDIFIIIANNQHKFNRSMNIFVQSSVHFTKTTAFLISLNVAGMGLIAR